MALTKQEVDARVQAAVENLQAGRGVEDDAGIEFKGEWPEPAGKARQLAGAANALRGEPLVYVIGVHDKTGAITTPTKTEPQEWYSQIQKPFDQIAPELLWVQTVFIGEQSESVQVLVFATDQFPYVINVPNRREVPMRVATGTESAHRNQLVRMFEPSLRRPGVAVTVASVAVDWEERPRVGQALEPEDKSREASLTLRLDARVFVEHTAQSPATLPVRDMRARLNCGEWTTALKVRVPELGRSAYPVVVRQGDPLPPEPVSPQHGVYARDQHVVATSPGEFSISTQRGFDGRRESNQLLSGEVARYFPLLHDAAELKLDLALRVVGVEGFIKLSAALIRTTDASLSARGAPGGERISGSLGRFELLVADVDPWGS